MDCAFRHHPPVHIISVILPVFGIALLGYVLTAVGWFRITDVPGLTRYVFNIALPIMLFDSMSRITLPDTVQWSLLVAYYLPAIALFVVAARIGRKAFGHNRTESGIYGMGASYSNTVLIGLPIVSTVWGDAGVLPLMMIISVHTAILFTLTTAVAESGGGNGGSVSDLQESHMRPRELQYLIGKTAIGMVTNPVFGGLVIGLLFNAASVTIEGPVGTMIGWIRGSALPAALFVTGASLRRYRGMGHIPEAGTLVFLKLIVHPIAVFLLARFVFQLPPLWTAVGVVTAALPTGVNASVFANKYDAGVAPVVTATLASTMLSIVTITFLIATLGPPV